MYVEELSRSVAEWMAARASADAAPYTRNFRPDVFQFEPSSVEGSVDNTLQEACSIDVLTGIRSENTSPAVPVMNKSTTHDIEGNRVEAPQDLRTD